MPQARRHRRRAARAAGGNQEMTFSIPAAPILIPKGPWKEIDGCVCAPKGFRAQGRLSQARLQCYAPGEAGPPEQFGSRLFCSAS